MLLLLGTNLVAELNTNYWWRDCGRSRGFRAFEWNLPPPIFRYYGGKKDEKVGQLFCVKWLRSASQFLSLVLRLRSSLGGVSNESGPRESILFLFPANKLSAADELISGRILLPAEAYFPPISRAIVASVVTDCSGITYAHTPSPPCLEALSIILL